MKYGKDTPAGGSSSALVPLECQNPNLLKCCDKNVAVARALQREKHRSKRREKENLWKKKNCKNAKQDPVVIHYPSRSALQTLHKSSSRAQGAHYFQGGLNHDWVGYYERGVTSDQSCINEWNAMDSLESRRPPSPDSFSNKEETEYLIRSKLKAIMTQVDIDEVTSKYIRQRLEEELVLDLFKFKSYIDQEMLVILGQMDAATEIFPHVYLGSEWNASNLEELQKNGVGYILNVTKEIDNFYPGTFDYLNIRVYDDEKTELLKHWDSTFKYIAQVKARGSKVLVHCKMGISRSASVVIAYAMKAFNMSLDEALNLVKKKRTCIKPNQAFCSQLKTYEGILDASRQRHNILWRSKSETNLKSASATTQLRNHHHRAMKNHPSIISDDMAVVDNGNRRDTALLLLHKSTEELLTTNKQFNDRHDSSFDDQDPPPPPPPPLRRPKSWSPDDHTSGVLFPKSAVVGGEGGNDFGESWRLSQSLNVQSWRAHVTLQQRDILLGDFNMEGGPNIPPSKEDVTSSPPVAVVEALNPLYTDIPGTIHEVSSLLQLSSSSVKERINEFESVQTNTHSGTAKVQNLKKGETELLQSISSSTDDDFGHLSSTAELDKVIETLLSPNEEEEEEEELRGSEPVLSQTKPAAQKHQAILVPSSQIWLQEEKVELDEENTPMDITADIIPKESGVGILPTGIVKRQKQDFEEKVVKKLSEPKQVENSKDGNSTLSRQSSSGSLSSGHFPRVVEVIRSPSYGRQESSSPGSEVVKRDDPFSVKLDKVFDREERKQQQRLSAVNPQVGEIKDTPSRNSSWGSFDSAVVLPDREFPSRQSSWGSCDTRTTVPSRNSSFGPFDIKQQQQSVKESVDETRLLRSNISGTYFEKDTGGMFSPGTIRRNKSSRSSEFIKYESAEGVKLDTDEIEFSESANEDSGQTKSTANVVKAYGPAPYKSPVERVAPTELSDNGLSDSRSTPIVLPISIPDSKTLSALTRSHPLSVSSSCTTVSQKPPADSSTQISEVESSENIVCCKGGGSPIVEIEDVLVPGTVRQQKELLESKNQEAVVHEKLTSVHSAPQSYSSETTSGIVDKTDSSVIKCSLPLGRSFSEKRAKFEAPTTTTVEADCDEGGKVKKLTQQLEQQKRDDEKERCRRRMVGGMKKGIRKRSHSLEILNIKSISSSSSSSSPSSSSSSSSSSPVSPPHPAPTTTYSPSHLLDEILVQAETDVRNLHQKESSEDEEEICVKSLVGKFEDSKGVPQGGPPAPPPKVQTRNVRAKSDSSTPDRFLPPVPQRKSSLDYNFKPNYLRAHSQPPLPTSSSVKQSPSPVSTNVSSSSSSPVEKLPSPPATGGKAPYHKPPPGSGRGQTCGVEVRQKKQQQGKSHPLTKLTKTSNRSDNSYHTM